MNFLLDTNICSQFLKRPGSLAHRFIQHSGGLAIPSLVLAELYTWAHQRSEAQKLIDIIRNDLLSDVTVIDFDSNCAMSYGTIRAKLLQTGLLSNGVDLLIAAVAITHDLTFGNSQRQRFSGDSELENRRLDRVNKVEFKDN
jgi:predicted nucleic acid-binding protein